MKRIAFALMIASPLLSAPASAQPSWQVTGSVEATIGGEPRAFHTFVGHVPDDVAEDIEDEAARDFAERVAGTEQHSATWMATEPVTVGETVILPAAVHVTIAARGDRDPSADEGQLDIGFTLDAESLALDRDMEIQVRYFPESWSTTDFYALTAGTLELEHVEAVDDRTLTVSGSIRGTLSFQEGSAVEHNPDDTLPIEATFRIERVVGSDLLPDLLGP